MLHIGRSDEIFRLRQPRRPDAHGRPTPACRRSRSPSDLEEVLQQLHRTGQRNDVFYVGDFAALDFAILRSMIRIGEEFANRGDAGTPVRFLYDFVGVETMFVRPARPGAGHRWRGIH